MQAYHQKENDNFVTVVCMDSMINAVAYRIKNATLKQIDVNNMGDEWLSKINGSLEIASHVYQDMRAPY